MPGICTTGGVGVYQASEGHFATYGRLYKPDGTRRGVMIAGGVGSTYLNYPVDSISAALADQGIPTFAADWGGTATFGNDTARTRVGTGRTWMNTNLGTRTDKVVLYGSSMGGATMLRYALANPTLVAAIGLLIPPVDLQDVYDNNRGGYQASLSAAYGGRPSDAQNPADNAASYTGIPIRIWYSGNDPICVPAAITAFAAASGATAVNMGNLGHAVNPAYASDVAEFFMAYA